FAWVGKGFESSVVFVRILAAGYFFGIVSGIASSMTAGLGKTMLDRNYGLLVAVVNIFAIVIGAVLFGPVGVAVGTSFSLIVGAMYFIVAFHRTMNISTRRIANIFVKPVSICAAGALFAREIIHALYPMSFSRTGAAVSLFVALFLDLVIVISALLALKVLDSYDIGIIRRIVQKIAAFFQPKHGKQASSE
ncbi:MAG: polysaccharide biosynthesis C-terminal domain-containing protein, partial [Bacteroidota bacterium]|nr:polysaccharide biosynthesis C-terminal domain-containing protein [Bacteroidota bacterium]